MSAALAINNKKLSGFWAENDNDHLGSAASITDKSGQILGPVEHFTPYGEALTPNAANDTSQGITQRVNILSGGQNIPEEGPAGLAAFTGHIRDKATGLTYMQARYYDPVIGRFLSVDPVGFMDTGAPGMFNRYAYVENDPINMIDPFGLCGTGSNDGQTGSCGNNEDYTPPVPETSRNESELATGEAIDMSGALIEAVVSGGPGGFAVKGLGKAALKKGTKALGKKGSGKKASDAGKSSRHGDSGRALSKAEKQIKELERKAASASGREKIKLNNKIQNIRKNAAKAKRGVEHSRRNPK